MRLKPIKFQPKWNKNHPLFDTLPTEVKGWEKGGLVLHENAVSVCAYSRQWIVSHKSGFSVLAAPTRIEARGMMDYLLQHENWDFEKVEDLTPGERKKLQHIRDNADADSVDHL